MTTPRTGWLLLLRRPERAVAWLLLGALLGAGVMGLAAVRLSAQRALLDTLEADLGGRAFALQTGHEPTAALLATLREVSPVEDERGRVLSRRTGLAVDSPLQVTSDPALELGVVTQGRRPSAPGEGTISVAVAEALDVAVGDEVLVSTRIGERAVRVAGLTTNPADRSTRSAVLLVDGRSLAATRWLSDTPFIDIPALQDPLEQRLARYQSTAALADRARQAGPAFIGALTYLPLASALLVTALAAGLGAASRPTWARSVDALIAAGMPQRTAWRSVLAPAAGTAIAGMGLGAVVTLVGLDRARSTVSAWFGQYWLTVPVPWGWVIVLAAVAAVSGAGLAAMPHPAAGGFRTAAQRLSAGRRPDGVTALVVLVGGLALWGATVRWPETGPLRRLVVVLPVVAAVSAAAFPFVLARALRVRASAATRALVRPLGRSLAPVVAVSAAVAVLAGAWSAQQYAQADTAQLLDSPLQPSGSFVVSSMPDSAVTTLATSYSALGGRELRRWQLPVESVRGVRATSPTLVRCMADAGADQPENVPDSCWPTDTGSPVNVVMLSTGESAAADPGLVDDGRVGVLVFPVDGQGTVSESAVVSAVPDPALGGLLPGLVVPIGGELATRFELRPSGSSEVVLLDFARLDQAGRQSVRAMVARLAPSAQAADGTDPTAYDRLRSTATLAALLGAAGSLAIMLLGGLGVVGTQATARRTLAELGGRPARRAGVLARWVAPAVLSAPVTAVLGLWTAQALFRTPGVTVGPLWFLPAASMALGGLVVAFAAATVPSRAED